jgi:hypothetical protein
MPLDADATATRPLPRPRGLPRELLLFFDAQQVARHKGLGAKMPAQDM